MLIHNILPTEINLWITYCDNSRWYSGNTCYLSVQKQVSSLLLS